MPVTNRGARSITAPFYTAPVITNTLTPSTPTGGGKTYYFDPAGNNSNNGLSSGAAKQTLDQIANLTLNPGDQILLKGGATFTSNITLNNVSGSSTNPIIIGSYGTSRAIIKPTSIDLHGILLVNPNYITIQDLDVIGLGRKHSANRVNAPYTSEDCLSGIFIWYSTANGTFNNLVLQRCDFCSWFNGLRMETPQTFASYSNYPQVNGFNVTYCNFYDNCLGFLTNNYGNSTTYAYPVILNNPYVGYCDFSGNPGSAEIYGYRLGIGLGIAQCNAQGALIEHCIAYSIGWACDENIAGPSGIEVNWCNAAIIQYCEAAWVGTEQHTDGNGFDLDFACTNCIIQYCYAHHNAAGGMQFTATKGGNILRYNILENNCTSTRTTGIQGVINHGGLNGSYTDYIYNNTFITTDRYYPSAIKFILFTPNSTLIANNNLFLSTSFTQTWVLGTSAGHAFNFDYNLYCRANLTYTDNAYDGNSLSTWKGYGLDAHSYWTDPMLYELSSGTKFPGTANKLNYFKSYQLMAGSPCIGAGKNISNNGGKDFLGNAVPATGATDIGAIVFTNTQSLVSSVPANYQAETKAYYALVQTAGDSYYQQNLKNLDDLVVGLKADGLWSLFYELWVSGANSFAGGLVKLIAAPSVATSMTNHNLVSTDYNRTNGFAGNASNKYLDTGFVATAQSGIVNSNFEVGCLAGSYTAVGTVTGSVIGGCNFAAMYIANSGSLFYYKGGNFSYPNNNPGGLFSFDGSGMYYYGSLIATPTNALPTLDSTSFTLLCDNESGGLTAYTNTPVRFYFISQKMNATQKTNLVNRIMAYFSAMV